MLSEETETCVRIEEMPVAALAFTHRQAIVRMHRNKIVIRRKIPAPFLCFSVIFYHIATIKARHTEKTLDS